MPNRLPQLNTFTGAGGVGGPVVRKCRSSLQIKKKTFMKCLNAKDTFQLLKYKMMIGVFYVLSCLNATVKQFVKLLPHYCLLRIICCWKGFSHYTNYLPQQQLTQPYVVLKVFIEILSFYFHLDGRVSVNRGSPLVSCNGMSCRQPIVGAAADPPFRMILIFYRSSQFSDCFRII